MINQTTVQLDVEEAVRAQAFFARCDGQVEGYRMAMESAKQIFVEHLLSQRKKPESPEPWQNVPPEPVQK